VRLLVGAVLRVSGRSRENSALTRAPVRKTWSPLGHGRAVMTRFSEGRKGMPATHKPNDFAKTQYLEGRTRTN
jgi:hypothetical protein